MRLDKKDAWRRPDLIMIRNKELQGVKFSIFPWRLHYNKMLRYFAACDNVESIGLSRKDVQFWNKWTRRIKGTTC